MPIAASRSPENLDFVDAGKVARFVQPYYLAALRKQPSRTEAAISVAFELSEALSSALAALTPLSGVGRLKAAAIFRGVAAKEQMLTAQGGCISAAETAALLHVSKTRVHARYKAGSLLGVRIAKQNAIVFPRWQFDENERRVDPTIAAALQELRKAPLDDWGRMDFFLSPRDSLKGKSPLELLKTQPARIVSLASAHVE